MLSDNKFATTGNLVETLGEKIEQHISATKKIWIAVALAGDYSLDLLSHVSKDCEVRIVVGIDLPTPISVLRELKKRFKNTRVYYSEFFHPKMYLFQFFSDEYVAYIGSSNFTKAGLTNNIELSYQVNDQKECQIIKQWFDTIYGKANEITTSFLNQYQDYFNSYEKQKKQRRLSLQTIIENQKSIIADNEQLLKNLSILLKSETCKERIKRRKRVVKALRSYLDYDNNFEKIDVDNFTFREPELGHIIPIYKNQWHEAVENGSLKRLLTMLCDDTIDIEERIQKALLDKNYKIEGVGINFITKVLVVHNAKLYMVWNNVVERFIKEYHFEFEKGTKIWTKYRLLCEHFSGICKNVGIKNFAELDAVLFDAMLNQS